LASHSQTDYSRALRWRTPHVSLLQEANKALRAIERVVRRFELETLAQSVPGLSRDPLPQREKETKKTAPPEGAPAAAIARACTRAAASSGLIPLNEAASKEILRAYGFALPEEAFVHSPDHAIEAARRIGFPVVLKAVAAELTHKSDAGAVALELTSATDVLSAYERISDNLVRRGFSGAIEGMLVCRQIVGGLELALGLHRDPEVGLVIMAGTGGLLLDLTRDVAFCAPPISREKANDLLGRTHAVRLMRGYRGGPALDAEAAVEALIALGRLAADLGDVIEAVDVNPFVVLPQGGLALDALVVLRGQATKPHNEEPGGRQPSATGKPL
jgi:succinyl-CoA synthetase beta subunit